MLHQIKLPHLPQAAGLSLLIVAGVVLLLFGWRLYRVLLVMIVVAGAGLLAAWLVRGMGMWGMLVVGLPVGFLCGLASATFERYGVFAMGCVAGAAPILDSRVYFFSDHSMYAAALATGLIAGSLAVLFWRPGIILCLSVLGAVCVERGALLVSEHIRPGLGEAIIAQNNLALSLILLGLILLGVLVQDRESKVSKGGPPEATHPGTPAATAGG